MKKIPFLLFSLLCTSFSNGQKKILFIAPSEYQKKICTMPSIKKSYSFVHYSQTPTDIDHVTRRIKRLYKNKKLSGVINTQDCFGNVCAAITAKNFDLPGPPLRSVLTCQHKYYSRLTQQKIVPSATPRFGLIDPKSIRKSVGQLPFNFPFFVKPVKSCFSFGAMKVDSLEELEKNSDSLIPHATYLDPLDDVLKRNKFPLGTNYLLAEELLEGNQITIEGFVVNGKVQMIGVVDSIMYPNTISFEYFEYPSSLPVDVQKRIAIIAEKFIMGIGFDNSFFNIEMMYNPESEGISIIEINPRSAPQFADLYEKVDGINPYEIMFAIATLSPLPTITRRKGPYTIAASFTLRVFEDTKVVATPTKRERAHVSSMFPDTRIEIHATRGKNLSDELQDGKSYLYATINVGGNNKKDLLSRLGQCKRALTFKFFSKVA
jgi:biotin carboxylase